MTRGRGDPRPGGDVRRVAVTGIGILSSLGNDFAAVTRSLRDGRSGLHQVAEWRDHGLRSWVAGRLELSERIAASQIGRRRLATMGEASAWCALAAEDAFADAGLGEDERAASAFGCIVGSGVASLPVVYQGAKLVHEGHARKVRPHSILQTMSSATSAHLVQAFAIGGRSYSLSAACATSANTLGHAFELIRGGRLDGAVAGGSEELNLLIAAGFSALRTALSTAFNDDPPRASRPFDADRDGFVLSGGAGIVVLEELERARRRGARIYGEILGYAANSDAHDPILPEPEGRAAAACMARAIADAGLEPEQIDYLNAHGTGTPSGDVAEVRAAEQVFGNALPPLSSTKSLGGHALGAAGVHEAIHSLAMMDGGFLAASANLERLDPAIARAPILETRLDRPTRIHLSNSFGFGGSNACLVLTAGDAPAGGGKKRDTIDT